MRYVVRWKRVEEDQWHNFNTKVVFSNLEKAKEFVAKEQEENNGSYEFEIFEEEDEEETAKCPYCKSEKLFLVDKDKDLYVCLECGGTIVPQL